MSTASMSTVGIPAGVRYAATAASNALPLYTANPGDFTGAEAFVELVGVQGRPDDL